MARRDPDEGRAPARSRVISDHRGFMRAFLASFILASWPGHSFVIHPQAQGTAAAGDEPRLIRVQERLVDIRIEEAPLIEVLREISAQSGIKVVLHGAQPAKISAEFRSVPLDRALRRLIKENFLLLYTSDGHLIEAWIWSMGDSRASVPPVGRELTPRTSAGVGRALDSHLSGLQQGDAERRRRAVLALGELRDERALGAVISALEGDQDPEVRQAAIWALQDFGGRQAMAAVGAALSRDSDETVRQYAVEALATMGDRESLDHLSQALREDPEPFVRYEALVSLAEIGGERAGALLRQALDDADELIRAKAEEILESAEGGER